MPRPSLNQYNGPKELSYLFVDGGCLRKIFQNFSDIFLDGREIDINFEALGRGFSKVYYYDAIYVKKHNETQDEYEARIEPMVTNLQKIRMLDRYHVYEGDVRRRVKRGNEQKKVDVMIAVDMLSHTFHRNMHKATLLTNDLDFKPLIDALVQNGMDVELVFEPGFTNMDLISSADKKSPMRPKALLSMVKNIEVEELNKFIPSERIKSLIDPSTVVSTKDDEKGTSWTLFEVDGIHNLQGEGNRVNIRYAFRDQEKLFLWLSKNEIVDFESL